ICPGARRTGRARPNLPPVAPGNGRPGRDLPGVRAAGDGRRSGMGRTAARRDRVDGNLEPGARPGFGRGDHCRGSGWSGRGVRPGVVDAGRDSATGSGVMMKRDVRARGNTLIEILVVVAVLAILAGWLLPKYLGHSKSSGMTDSGTAPIQRGRAVE